MVFPLAVAAQTCPVAAVVLVLPGCLKARAVICLDLHQLCWLRVICRAEPGAVLIPIKVRPRRS